MSKTFARLWIVLIVLAVLTPLGLLLPRWFGAGSAWGEWAPDEVGQLVGFIPERLRAVADLWKAPVPDYALPGSSEASMTRLSIEYIGSALLGVVLCGALAYAATLFLKRGGR